MKSALKIQIIALTPIILFIVLRAIIYEFYPVESFDDWVQVDFIKNIPRIISFILAYIIAKKFLAGIDWNIFTNRGRTKALLYLIIILSFSWINGYWSPPHELTLNQVILISIGSFFTAVLEEFVFRFLLLRALMISLTEAKSLLLSSFAFMVFHVQAQPLYAWLYLFMAGVQFGALRLMGVSLVWLMIGHGIYDTLWFYLESGGLNTGYIIFTALNTILAIYYWRQRILDKVFV